MSHLKKLSQVLSKLKPPQAYQVTRLGGNNELIEYPAYRHTTITKQMSAHQIPSLILSAKKEGLVSLASSQLRFNSSFFVMNSEIIKDKWTGYSINDSNYKVFINPSILDISAETVSGLEECPSLPLLVTQVERNKSVLVQYMNLEGEYIEEELEDFPARVFQHEVDHLSGYLMTHFSVSFGRIHSINPGHTKNVLKVLEDFKDKIQKVLVKYEESLKSSGPIIGKQADSKDRQFIEKVIFDPQFEEEFKEIFREACTQDYFESK